MNKKIIIITLVTLLILFLLIFFLRKEFVSVVEPEGEQETEITEQEKFQQYFISLTNGKVVSVGENYFTMDVAIIQENDLDKIETEKYIPETISVKVNVTDQTEFVDANDVKFVVIPEEYQKGLAQFNYIQNIVEGDYVVSVYVDTLEDLNKTKFIDGEEVTATYISWSCYPQTIIDNN